MHLAWQEETSRLLSGGKGEPKGLGAKDVHRYKERLVSRTGDVIS